MTQRLLLSLLTTTLLLGTHLFAEEMTEDDLSGFDEISLDDEEEFIESEPERVTLTGDLAFKTSYGYRDHSVAGVEYGGFNEAQTSLYLQLDAKLSDAWKMRISGDTFYDLIYDIHNDYSYNTETLDAYRFQLRFDDVYLQGELSRDLDVKIGRQIVVWGKSDNIRITDVINPLDNRLPGMTDIEDLRLSTTMAKFDYYLEKWNLSAMIIPESRVFIEAAPRSEFFPVDVVFPGAPDPFIELHKPTPSWDNMQYAFAANGIFSGWDLSLYGADVFDAKWYLNQTTKKREVSKIQMIGSAINIAYGSWLFKSEIAYLQGVKYNSTTDAKERLDSLIGFEYMGISDTTLSLEIADRHIFDYESQMSSLTVRTPDYVDEDEFQTAIRATHSMSNDTLNATALVSMFGKTWEYGGFVRVWLEYEVATAINANLGFVDYIDGEKPFLRAISNNDRVFADITYSF